VLRRNPFKVVYIKKTFILSAAEFATRKYKVVFWNWKTYLVPEIKESILIELTIRVSS